MWVTMQGKTRKIYEVAYIREMAPADEFLIPPAAGDLYVKGQAPAQHVPPGKLRRSCK